MNQLKILVYEEKMFTPEELKIIAECVGNASVPVAQAKVVVALLDKILDLMKNPKK